MWLCNLNSHDIARIFKEWFWREVLVACVFFKSVKKLILTILSQWQTNSSGTTIVCMLMLTCLLVKDYQAGLCTLEQLIISQGNIIEIDAMQCNQIISAIPSGWRKLLQTRQDGNSPPCLLNTFHS